MKKSPSFPQIDDAMATTVLELVPRGGFARPESSRLSHLSRPDLLSTATSSTPNSPDDEDEGHRYMINAKLIEEAVKRAASPGVLFVVLSNEESDGMIESRKSMTRIYNDLWDHCLVHSKLDLDTRVLPTAPDALYAAADRVFGAGRALHPGGRPEAISLEEAVQEEARVPYLLYDEVSPRLPAMPHVVLGGTFDRLHNGHRKLLTVALQVCRERLLIGVTSSKMLEAKRSFEKIESTEDRTRRVREVCESSQRAFVNPATREPVQCEIVRIDDAFGPAVTRPELDGIVVSSETIKGARLINEVRKEKGMKLLIPIVLVRSNAFTLSSTFLRDKL